MEEMVVVLTTQMRAPVRDRTGIAGTYDFDVAFSTGVDRSDKPVLVTAIQIEDPIFSRPVGRNPNAFSST